MQYAHFGSGFRFGVADLLNNVGMRHYLWLLVPYVLVLAACRKEGSYNAEGPMQRAGAWVDNAAVKTGQGVTLAAQKTGEGMQSVAQATATGMENAGRTMQSAFGKDAGTGQASADAGSTDAGAW